MIAAWTGKQAGDYESGYEAGAVVWVLEDLVGQQEWETGLIGCGDWGRLDDCDLCGCRMGKWWSQKWG